MHREAGQFRSAPAWVRLAAAVIRRLPAGRYRTASAVARLRPRPFAARMARDTGGLLFWCDLREDIARDVCLVGIYEPQETNLLSRLLRPGMTVVDAGANWGYFTLLSAHFVGTAGRVLSLEPDPRVFELLRRNLALNDLPQVTALAVAAGACRGTLTLDGYDPSATNRGVSRVRIDADPVGLTTFAVASERLDETIAEHRLAAVDLVKIDVEGFEDAVLAGMAAGLRAHTYRRVLVEFHPALLAEHGASVEACCLVLARAGYTGWAFDHSQVAGRRAAYVRALPLRDLLSRADQPPGADPWPHMLWTLPQDDPRVGAA